MSVMLRNISVPWVARAGVLGFEDCSSQSLGVRVQGSLPPAPTKTAPALCSLQEAPELTQFTNTGVTRGQEGRAGKDPRSVHL